MVIKFIFFFIIFNSPIIAMEAAKNIAAQARYYLLPASANPATWFHNNFYAIQDGAAYRSKTLSASVLDDYIKKYEIKTILNLRENHGYWFDKEQEVATKNSVALLTETLSGYTLPSAESMRIILALFNDPGNRPFLIHCQAGADRTGMIAAFWKLTQENATLEQALAQQTAGYGHYEWRFPAMRQFTTIMYNLRQRADSWQHALDLYEQALMVNQLPGKPMVLRLADNIKQKVQSRPRAAIALGILSIAAMVALISKKASVDQDIAS